MKHTRILSLPTLSPLLAAAYLSPPPPTPSFPHPTTTMTTSYADQYAARSAISYPFAVHEGPAERLNARPVSAHPSMFRGVSSAGVAGLYTLKPGVDVAPTTPIPAPGDGYSHVTSRPPFPFEVQPRPLRGLRLQPPSDAAGLLEKWHGRSHEQKRHVKPSFVDEATGAPKEIMASPGRKKTPYSHSGRTTKSRDIMGCYGYQGVEDMDTDHVFTRRMINGDTATRGYLMKGATVNYTRSETPEKKVRGPGIQTKAAQVPTKARIMGQEAGQKMTPKEVDPDLNTRAHVKYADIHPTDTSDKVLRNTTYGNGKVKGERELFDQWRVDERKQREKQVIGQKSLATAAHSAYYRNLYRARGIAQSTIFTDPLYERRPKTAGP